MTTLIAFDGLNRCGKGTQAELLQSRLREINIFSVIVRGDGSREGLGKSQGDPENRWWSSFKQQIRGTEGTKQWFVHWNEAACILARELIQWKNIILPKILREAQYTDGVLLIDRSLISRIMVLHQANEYNGVESLYTIDGLHQGIDWKEVLPDQLFNFCVPRQVLLSRLETNDPKYEFRKKIIEHCFFTSCFCFQ